MNREEILRRAQNERVDEMEILIKDKSMKWTYIAMVIAAAIFSFIRLEQGLPMMDLCATVCISVCAGQAYRYIKSKDKSALWMAVITLIVAIGAAIRFAMGH